MFPKLSVRENLILAGQEHQGTMASRLVGRSDAGLTDAANQMIGFFKLDHLADEPAGGLSYGQQKLLDAAMAFMGGPRLVLLDEPAGGVNPTMLADLKERLVAINREKNATFVVIEHNMEFVMSLCSRVMVMAEGKVLAMGRPDEVREEPRRDRSLSRTLGRASHERSDPLGSQPRRRLRQDDDPERHDIFGAARRPSPPSSARTAPASRPCSRRSSAC